MEPKNKGIQLSEAELEMVRRHDNEVMQQFTTISDMILTKLGKKPLPLGPDGIVEIRFRPNNKKILIYSSAGLSGGTQVVGVLEDPPGICREPTEEERRQ
jgi:hypothetical protein